jgi:di/tricarboxylate transporter
MFDFSPVGVGVALSGVAFIALGGWRLIPRRKGQRSREDLFQVEDYITEVRLPEDSLLVGKSLRTLGSITKAEAVVLSVIRNARKELVPSTFMRLCAGDILMVEASSADLERLVQDARLELVAKEDGKEEKKVGEKENGKEQDDRSAEVGLGEAIILPNSMYVGWTANSLNLRHRYGINLLAVARKGERLKSRLNQIRFKAGDILLVQGEEERRQEAESALGWLPLAERGLRLGEPRRLLLGTCIFGLALVFTVAGWLPVTLAFVGAATAMRLVGLLSLREIYESIDWPIIVLLGALIPVGAALESTGGAQSIADLLLRVGSGAPPVVSLVILLVGAMTLSDVINNAAAAVLMAPIAFKVAVGLDASPDPFLICVAVGCSCAFLTPIGHQSNTLVLAPGGYRFGDYARMGLPLEILVVLVATPLIQFFWPL